MTWLLLFVVIFIFFFGVWKISDIMFDKAAAIRAENRAKEHFRKTEAFRNNIK